MNAKFLSNLVLVLVVNALVKPVYIFGIEAQIQNIVGSETYGLFFAIFNLTYLFQISTDLGLQNYTSTILAKDNEGLKTQFPSMLTTKALLSLLYVVAVILVCSLLGYVITSILVVLVVINQVLTSMFLFCRANIAALGFYRIDSVISGLDKFLMILFVGSLILLPKDYPITIELFVGIQMLTLITSILVSILILVFKGQVVFKLARIEWQKVMVLIKKSLPFALIILLMSIYNRVDGVMIQQLRSDGELEAGIYAGSYRILHALNMVGILFAGLLLPMFSRMMSREERINDLTRLAATILWGLSGFFVLIAWTYADEILNVLYVEADLYWTRIFRILIPTYFAFAITTIYGTLLTASEELKAMNILFLVGVVINVCLNFVLIPAKGAYGAAISTAITQAIVAIGLVVLCFKLTTIGFHMSWFIELSLFTLALFFTLWIIFVFNLKGPWLLIFLSVSLGFCLLLFLRKPIRIAWRLVQQYQKT